MNTICKDSSGVINLLPISDKVVITTSQDGRFMGGQNVALVLNSIYEATRLTDPCYSHTEICYELITGNLQTHLSLGEKNICENNKSFHAYPYYTYTDILPSRVSWKH